MRMTNIKGFFYKIKESKIREKDSIKLFQIIIYTISIVTFLTALQYFSGKPSINISLSTPPISGFHMDTLQEFYRENNIEIPKILIEDPNLSKLFETKAEFVPKDYIDISAGTSDLGLVKAIKRGQQIGGYIKLRIEVLEHQIRKHSYKKRVYIYGGNRGFYEEEKFEKVLNYIKPKLSQDDYFIFLSALIFSREIENQIFIKNDGDVDLKKIEVMIPSPLCKITESRENNVLKIDILSTLPHNIEKNSDNMRIYIPKMKKDEHFSLNIITRENQIEKDEISFSFNEDKKINIRKIELTTFGVFLLMGLLSLYFRGK